MWHYGQFLVMQPGKNLVIWKTWSGSLNNLLGGGRALILPFFISFSFNINPTVKDLEKGIILVNKKIFLLPFFCQSFFFLPTAQEYQKLLEERQNICVPYLKLLFSYNFYGLFGSYSMTSSVDRLLAATTVLNPSWGKHLNWSSKHSCFVSFWAWWWLNC